MCFILLNFYDENLLLAKKMAMKIRNEEQLLHLHSHLKEDADAFCDDDTS